MANELIFDTSAKRTAFFWPGNDNPILVIRHLLFTACATFGINSPKQYHKSYKYSSFDDPLCEKCTKVAQGVIK